MPSEGPARPNDRSSPQVLEPLTARLFLALWPDEPVRQALLACRDAWQWARHAGPVPPRHLHLTLHFLGEVPRARLPDLIAGLSVAVAPFEVTLGPLAVWPNGVAVWEPSVCPDVLTQLHQQLGQALMRLGVPLEDRPYRPHVTLARRARDAQMPWSVPPLTWPVDHYALVESCPGTPRRYEVLRLYR
ncbi:MAG TPA: RNA 2',3'-cyclic phosphodiesterase [Burkholderiaceae bacterium]|nr:RNA 2',3'-cyclic phosphodiesterase [Burkholderiaceae bacterium]